MEISKLFGNIKRRRRKRLFLYLLNDDKNSFNYVLEALTTYVPMCNSLRAEQIAMIAHNTGQCCIYSGFAPDIYFIYAHLQKNGLQVQVRDTNQN